MSSATAIAVAVAAAAVVQLATSGALDRMVDGFFAFGLTAQLSALALLFSIVFAAVSVSQSSSNKTALSVKTEGGGAAAEIEYPLEVIAEAETDKAKLECVFDMLREEILQQMGEQEMTPESIAWCREMMDYNVPGGKLDRGTTVLSVHRTLAAPRNLTDTEVARACVLGWAVEFLRSFVLVADDIMDNRQTRRGQPCWYTIPKVQLSAINDSFLLESFVFTILKQHFGTEPYYYKLVQLFLDVIQKTEFGELLDLTIQPGDSLLTSKKDRRDLTRFTLERYQKIVQYKTAYYTFYLPIAIGMITSGVDNDDAYELANGICCRMGEYFQVQDDYLDCFGDPKVIGKVGTDIQDSKCSWLVVQALDRAKPAQRAILEKNYGSADPNKVERIKQLYRDMDLIAAFEDYEEESYKQIQGEIDKIDDKVMPRAVFEVLLDNIYKRSK